ncbi:carbamoyltransferase HypF [Methanobrevibacter filiformis]|uniref:Carbamoyltransferase n=1 Tax=Methanobrevibacter filiformis TaxID=55758 RepID=A0A165Z4N2_9EURY|nr:carbamoyltransferase HypF [Methanobrevibacter filiformis]KZX10243.1 carbamoyltransferase HypF [Methanobrevibacter filiformis]
MKTSKIFVEGIVQGVGFRPNIYRIAIKNNIKGYVKNQGNVVEIVAQGSKKDSDKFIQELVDEKPPVAKINSVKTEEIANEKEYISFEILKSSSEVSGSSVIPPDLAVCDNCLNEMRDKSNFRYNYPFIACTDCGPRFTVIKDIPYDRENTTMDEFPLCEECIEEYTNPLDRRYHAEATCCDKCGPLLRLYNSNSKEYIITDKPKYISTSKEIVKKAAHLLDVGNILAIKGIGGTHLVASVTDKKTSKTLRKCLNRLNQPFAVMSPDIETIETYAKLSENEKNSLKSIERPIVVVKKSKDYYFEDSVAPVLHNIGVMLPYSPFHHMLFEHTDSPAYIMTSANIPGEPMMIENKDIMENLSKIADYFLLHNRKIVNRCDDSVIRYVNNHPSFIRRSRGYAPSPYNISKYTTNKNILALGPELDVTFAIVKEGLCYISQHIGNTNKFKTYQFLQEAITHLMNITATKEYDIIACDMHPQFFTTKLAHELREIYNCPVTTVQHHHAHGAVLGYDNNIDEFVFIAADGVGYGEDHSAWGGEIFYTNMDSFERLGSLIPQKMPGGDISTKYPIRMLTSILKQEYDENKLKSLLIADYKDYFQYGEAEIDNVLKQLNSDLNVGTSTSTGRILDSISVALGICGERTYEGECSMKLESIAIKGDNSLEIPYEIKKENKIPRLDTSKLLKEVIELKKSGEKIANIGKASQIALSKGLSEIAIEIAEKTGVKTIGGTGGVFYNEAISKTIKDNVESNGYKFIQHKNSCAGDGSLSLGQAIIASKRI